MVSSGAIQRATGTPIGEDNMTTSRMTAVAIALSIAFGFIGAAGSTQRSAKDRNSSGTIASSKRMADGKEWTTANLNVNTSSSYCYDDAEPNCRRYGRLYTWESAQRGCQVARRWMADADRRRMASAGEALWWTWERFA
jgi:hypothetical protein